jgi:hypothetical protein
LKKEVGNKKVNQKKIKSYIHNLEVDFYSLLKVYCVNLQKEIVMSNSIEERFWEKVDKNISNVFYNGTRCWEWVASCDREGYGMFWVGGKTVLSHRVSWKLVYGEVPNGLVLHKCDNPSCVNPEHLFLGTRLDNMIDMVKKGRSSSCMLTQEQVLWLKSQPKPEWGQVLSTYRKWAKSLGVSYTAVANVLYDRNWKWLS